MSGRATLYVCDQGARFHLRWRCDDREHFEAILRDFREHFPTHADTCYSGATRSWSLPHRHEGALERWAARWFAPGDVSWESGDAEEGDREGGEEPAATGLRTIEQAYARLHLLPSAPPELVAAAHRIAVRRVHPDVGGSHAEAVAVNEAISFIRQYAEASGQ